MYKMDCGFEKNIALHSTDSWEFVKDFARVPVHMPLHPA